MATGAERIAAERQRQIEQEGWSPEHDLTHTRGELGYAAAEYAVAAVRAALGWGAADLARVPIHWPWDGRWWKPSDDPIRNLEKAGALIAAEIDRLIRARERADA